MVGEISARHALSKEVIEGVSERTGGVPLFVEEVTRLLVERGEQGGVQAIPPTLQQSLAARLDRLGPAREVAQIGAVLGRDFAYPLLRDVAEIDEPALQASLDRLADADLLFVEGAPPQANYRFKHALIQDAAYDSLLKSRRQALHRRAAEALARRASSGRARSDRPSFHPGRSRRSRDRMVGQGGRPGACAARPSRRRSPISARRSRWRTRRRAQCHGRSGRRAASSQRMKLQSDYGQAMMWSQGFAAEETKAAFARAARTRGEQRRLLRALRRPPTAQWTWQHTCGANCGDARELASTLPARSRRARAVRGSRRRPSRPRLHVLFAGDFLEARDPLRAGARACVRSAITSAGALRTTLGGRNVHPRANELAIGRGRTRARIDRLGEPARGRDRPRPVDGPIRSTGNPFWKSCVATLARRLERGRGSGAPRARTRDGAWRVGPNCLPVGRTAAS